MTQAVSVSPLNPSGDLLPCPFCGGKNVELYKPVMARLWAIHCTDCEISGEKAIDADIAVMNWNTRAPTTSRSSQREEGQ